MTHQFSACASIKERTQCFSSSCTIDVLKLAWQKKTFAVSISTTTQTRVCTLCNHCRTRRPIHARSGNKKEKTPCSSTHQSRNTVSKASAVTFFVTRLGPAHFFFPSHLRRAQTFTKAAMSDAGQTERCGGSTGLLLSSVTRNLKRTGHVCPPTPGPSRRGSEGCSGSSCCWKRSSGGDLAAAAAALLSSRREWSPAA